MISQFTTGGSATSFRVRGQIRGDSRIDAGESRQSQQGVWGHQDGRVNVWGQAKGERAFVPPGASSEETPTPLFHKEITVSVKWGCTHHC